MRDIEEGDIGVVSVQLVCVDHTWALDSTRFKKYTAGGHLKTFYVHRRRDLRIADGTAPGPLRFSESKTSLVG